MEAEGGNTQTRHPGRISRSEDEESNMTLSRPLGCFGDAMRSTGFPHRKFSVCSKSEHNPSISIGSLESIFSTMEER